VVLNLKNRKYLAKIRTFHKVAIWKPYQNLKSDEHYPGFSINGKKADTFCALLIVIEHASLNCSVLDFRKKLSRNIRVSPIKKGICEKFRSESD